MGLKLEMGWRACYLDPPLGLMGWYAEMTLGS